MNYKKQLLLVLLTLGFVVSAVIWVKFVAPNYHRLKVDFHYTVDVISRDNFYDPVKGDFIGEINSKSKFIYDVVAEEGGVLLVRNVFDVKTPDDQPIFSVERIYGIDGNAYSHVAGYGDKDRHGYLFGPPRDSGEDFVYWHVNYDVPAIMRLVGIEDVEGLKVNHYSTRLTADQTENLGHLPGVPERLGVTVETILDIWVDPHLGHLINYQDKSLAYYYDRQTGERLHPWNKFSNTLSRSSILENVAHAKRHSFWMFIHEKVLPIGFLTAALICALAAWRKSSGKPIA
jgi:hypothetical protein